MDPSVWATDAVASDGGVVRLRLLTPDDGERLLDFTDRLSDESLYYRFFSRRRPRTVEELGSLLDLDHEHRVAVAAELADQIVAVGMYVYEPALESAEVAFAVEDRHQLRGIGSLLLEHLAAIARANGIVRFHAQTLGDNQKMLRVFSNAGYVVHRSYDGGIWDVDFALDESADDAVLERERAAEAASVARLLNPKSVAVVGASPRDGSIGNALVRNLLDGAGFAGVIYPVNPNVASIRGLRAYPSITAIPDPVDLVVVAVPSPLVAGVLEEAGTAGVAGAVVITAGFSEAGSDGVAAQSELVDVAHRHGLRIIGPNCIGVVNTRPDVRLNATFAPVQPVAGSIGFGSQSGALGIAILDTTRELRLGLSSFVSLGNKADVSGNDLLQYWEGDDATQVALLYLESFGNPRKFARIARRFSRRKPLVVVKSGRTEAGRRAASSHTAALASSDVLADTLFDQSGIIRVATMEQLFDVARLLANQPMPAGNRVAIVGNSGGPGILAADACAGAGLEVPTLSLATQEALADIRSGAAVVNPVDLIADASAEQYEAALRVVLADDAVDAVIVIYTDPMVTEPHDIAAAVRRVVEDGATKPVAATFLSTQLGPVIDAIDADGNRRDVPVFRFPESPAVALGRVAWLAAWRLRPLGTPPVLDDIDAEAARQLVTRILTRCPEGTWLDSDDLAALLSAFGIAMVPHAVVSNASEAGTAAERFGRPLALKVLSSTIQHKSDVGGVALDVVPADAAAVYAGLRERLGEDMRGAILQPMVDKGVEVIVGVVNDPLFGPAIMFGMGGTATELFADRAFRIVPITDVDAATLVSAPRSSRLLDGYRGSEPVDRLALEDLVLRLGRMAETVPELVELDFNPVIARPDGAFIVDARARIAPVAGPPVRAVRHLDRPARIA